MTEYTKRLHCKRIEPSVDYCDGTCDELCSIAHQVMDGSAQLLRLSHSSERCLADDILSALCITAVRIGKQGTVLLGDEKSWCYGIDTNAFSKLLGALCGHVCREIGDTGFGCCITAYTGHRAEGCH